MVWYYYGILCFRYIIVEIESVVEAKKQNTQKQFGSYLLPEMATSGFAHF